ncbi:MAG: hypothetical protein ACR2OZ_00575 [Verrucomicrobiales bacterium]
MDALNDSTSGVDWLAHVLLLLAQQLGKRLAPMRLFPIAAQWSMLAAASLSALAIRFQPI